MIYVDVSESRTNSPTGRSLKNSQVEYTECNWLEAQTGADMLVTAISDMPLAPATLPILMSSGRSVLIQIKWHSDLTASISNRLNESIARMVQIAPYSYQRLLLPVGYYYRSPTDQVVLVGERKKTKENPFILWNKYCPTKNWRAYQTALRRWVLRGGAVLSTCHDETDFVQAVCDMERDLKEIKTVIDAFPDRKKLYQDGNDLVETRDPESDPLQQVKPVGDARLIIAEFPGIGPSLVNALARGVAERCGHAGDYIPSGADMLSYIGKAIGTHYKVPGWGDGRLRAAREFLGLEPNEVLTVVALSDYGTTEEQIAESFSKLSFENQEKPHD